LREFLVVYAVAIVSYLPWAGLLARDDGLPGDPTRIILYAIFGAILPALAGYFIARRSGSIWWGIGFAVVIGLMAWQGHGR
jgi:hypothetical protein